LDRSGNAPDFAASLCRCLLITIFSLTDMARNFDGGSALIEQWLKNKDTVLFLGGWEQLNNPGFNSPEFEGTKNEAGRNRFFLSAKKWIDATGAIGLHAKAGRYGGTFAHKDIAGMERSARAGQGQRQDTHQRNQRAADSPRAGPSANRLGVWSIWPSCSA
jgi:hypothetical protein